MNRISMVAPHVGAWIETKKVDVAFFATPNRIPRGYVD